MKLINEKKSIPDQVFDNLLDAISSGQLKVGDKLPSEHELCEMFDVSRASVKTAIDRLKLLGILEPKVGDGTYIKDVKICDFLDIYSNFFIDKKDRNELLQLRRVILQESFSSIIHTHDKELIESLRQIKNQISNELNVLNELNQNQNENIQKLNTEFLELICNASGNKYFIQLFQITSTITHYQKDNKNTTKKQTISHYESICKSLEEHNYETGITSLLFLSNIA